MEPTTYRTPNRAAAWLLSGTCLVAGCNLNSTNYIFETQPRTPLAAVGYESTRSPQIAISPAGMISLLMIYQDGTDSRVGFTMSHDGGDHFMPVKPVSAEGATISAHGENNPMMAVSSRAVFALWEQSDASGSKDLVVARSLNAGQSFEKPVRVNDNPSPSFHGFASLAVGQKGEVYVAWLDGRENPENPGTFDIYTARSTDKGATFGPNIRVGRSACPCCRPYVTIGKNDEVFIAWRKVFPGSIRDMVVSASKDSGQSFPQLTRVAEDGWQIQGCPESGASMLFAKNRLYVTWMTGGSNNRARVKLSWSDDAGTSFHSPIVAAKDVRDPNHPSLTRSENGQVWLSFQGRVATANESQWSAVSPFVAKLDGDTLGNPQVLANNGTSASYPVLAIAADENIFAAWTAEDEKGKSVVLLRGRQP
jgi:BNR repeat-like domain